MTTTFTVSTVYAALLAAAELAEAFNDPNSAVTWQTVAQDIKMAAHKHLYNAERQCFYKGLIVKDGVVKKTATIDTSSVFGAYLFGLFDSDSEELVASIHTVKEVFGVSQGSIGLPRYENDPYRRTNNHIMGNYWFITSLWLAQYNADNGSIEDTFKVLEWVRDSASSTGMMSEQIDPETNEIISPAPLTWTHAEYVSTLLDTIEQDR